MTDNARSFMKELQDRKIDLLEFIILADMYNQLTTINRVELREEAYERRFDD